MARARRKLKSEFISVDVSGEDMGIKYYKLRDLLNRKGLTRDELRKDIGISSATMAKISANQRVSLEVIEKICGALNCQPGDIMEYVADAPEKIK